MTKRMAKKVYSGDNRMNHIYRNDAIGPPCARCGVNMWDLIADAKALQPCPCWKMRLPRRREEREHVGVM